MIRLYVVVEGQTEGLRATCPRFDTWIGKLEAPLPRGQLAAGSLAVPDRLLEGHRTLIMDQRYFMS